MNKWESLRQFHRYCDKQLFQYKLAKNDVISDDVQTYLGSTFDLKQNLLSSYF